MANKNVPDQAGGISESDTLASDANNKAHRFGISHEEMVNVYTSWSESYEQDLCPVRYRGPKIAAEVMAKYYPEYLRSNIRILDIAAGTGRVGDELVGKGFKLIDALEPSQGMMDILEKKGIYDKKFLSSIGFKPISSIRADSYDSLVIAGGMGEGHIPVRAIDEMLRIIKSGGLIFIVMREEYLRTVEEYKKLEPFMQQLVYKQLWIQLERTVVPKYSFENDGVIYIFQKL